MEQLWLLSPACARVHFPAVQGREDTTPPPSVQLDPLALNAREQTSEKSFNYTWEIGATHLLKVFCMEFNAVLGRCRAELQQQLDVSFPPGKAQTSSDVDQS